MLFGYEVDDAEVVVVVIGGALPILYMIAALVAVPVSNGGASLFAWLAAAARSFASSFRLYLSRRTVRFLGELQIRSNWVRTSLIYLISSLVLGDCLNLTVLMNALLN